MAIEGRDDDDGPVSSSSSTLMIPFRTLSSKSCSRFLRRLRSAVLVRLPERVRYRRGGGVSERGGEGGVADWVGEGK